MLSNDIQCYGAASIDALRLTIAMYSLRPVTVLRLLAFILSCLAGLGMSFDIEPLDAPSATGSYDSDSASKAAATSQVAVVSSANFAPNLLLFLLCSFRRSWYEL
jgi:hypothetical protein